MAKSTLGRIGSILTSSINDALERLEDPEKQVRQLVRDMEAAVDKAVGSVGAAIADERRLTRRCDEQEREVERLEALARRALESGDEGVARSLTERRLVSVRAAADAAAALAESRETVVKLKGQLTAMRRDVQLARNRQGSLIARLQAAKAIPAWSTTAPVRRSEPHEEFRRLEQGLARSQEELEQFRAELEIREETNAAIQQTDPSGADVDFERQVAAVELSRRVDEEIDLLRKKVGS